jgi:hypothetical protein
MIMSMNWKLLVTPFFVGVSLLAQPAISRDPSAPVGRPHFTADDVKLGMVRNMIRHGSPLTSGSIQLHRMGDEAAVLLIKALGSTQPPAKWTDAQKQTVLEIVSKAFEKPSQITNPSNLRPDATNFLLNMLEQETEDAEMKLQISQVRSRASDAAASLSR